MWYTHQTYSFILPIFGCQSQTTNDSIHSHALRVMNYKIRGAFAVRDTTLLFKG